MGIIGWLKDQVQTATGEKERKENVRRLKELASEFKQKVGDAIEALNVAIGRFNSWIQKINSVRKMDTKRDIDSLNGILSKYGKCKKCQEFSKEETKMDVQFPMTEYEQIEDYIGDVDWSSDEVFLNTFLRTPIGMKITNKGQNLAMTEAANELVIKIDNTVRELNNRKITTEIETQICEQYVANVTYISDIIRNCILPEIKLIDAFLEAEQIKNSILAKIKINETEFYYGISGLVGTPYEKHYQFIKNAYMFYIVSCAIYETPILTNLLKHTSHKKDVENIISEGKVLAFQAANVKKNVCG